MYNKIFENKPYWSIDYLMNVKLNTDSNTLLRFLNELKYYKKEMDIRIKEVEKSLKEQKEFEKNF
jgi:hypothetical protein